jgi:hypothetical protein
MIFIKLVNGYSDKQQNKAIRVFYHRKMMLTFEELTNYQDTESTNDP